MTILIPNLRSYEDPITKGQEIWLEADEQKGAKEWLRCSILGPKKQIQNLDVIPVDIQRCIQKIQQGLLSKLHDLFAKDEDDYYFYIPTHSGELSNERSKPLGSRMKNMYLALGSNEIPAIPGMQYLSTHGSVHVMQGQVIEQPPAPVSLVFNQERSPLDKSQSTKDINHLPPRERILRIEEGLLHFEQVLLEKMSNLNLKRPGLPRAIQNPFTFVKSNQQNQLKHYADAVKEAEAHNMPLPAILFALPEPFYFSYAFREDIDNDDGVMAFAPMIRSVIMNAYRSPDYILDNVGFMHEMVHCMHAAQQRRTNMEKHFNFSGRKEGDYQKKVIIQEEYDAYAVELEALNIALDNILLTTSQSGKTLNHLAIAEHLQVTERQKMTVQMLCRLGEIYFKDSTIGTYSKDYLAFVNNMTMFDGYDLYSPEYQLISRSKDYF